MRCGFNSDTDADETKRGASHRRHNEDTRDFFALSASPRWTLTNFLPRNPAI